MKHMESERNGRKKTSCLLFQSQGGNKVGDLVQFQETITVAMDAVDNTGAEELVIGVEKVLTQGTMQSEGKQNEMYIAS